jgi:putative transposase
MSQTFAQILVHFVFSTKHRQPMLIETIRPELHAYMGGIVANLHGTLLRAGSGDDHSHLLVAHPRTCSPAVLVQEIKTGSTRWLKTKDPQYHAFQWQNGYGAFSVSPSHRTVLENYIDRQTEHHRKITFQDEYRRLLTKYGIAFDERYLWD